MASRQRNRRMLKSCVLLLLGAIVNVAVAWGCAVGVNPYRTTNYCNAVHMTHDQVWVVHRWETTSKTRILLNRCRTPPSTYTFHDGPAFDKMVPYWSGMSYANTPHQREFTDYVASGWPTRAMSYQEIHAASESPARTVVNVSGGMILDMNPHQAWRMRPLPRVLPLQAIWPGFAINTIFYAAILAVLFLAPGKVRRAIRHRRGLCPQCAYPIGRNEVCTECGEAITRRNT